jgi:hypothetical protein
MGQVLHGSATTTEAVRRAIQHSQASLRTLAATLAIEPAHANDVIVHDPWEKAIATARVEIRQLIASGDLGHEEVMAGWIEQWAAEIYHARRRAA